MQYEVVVGRTTLSDMAESSYGADEQLEKKVNEMIAQGWKPLGGVSTVLYRDQYLQFSQAMIKE